MQHSVSLQSHKSIALPCRALPCLALLCLCLCLCQLAFPSTYLLPDKMAICRYFQAGRCAYGNECRNEHPGGMYSVTYCTFAFTGTLLLPLFPRSSSLLFLSVRLSVGSKPAVRLHSGSPAHNFIGFLTLTLTPRSGIELISKEYVSPLPSLTFRTPHPQGTHRKGKRLKREKRRKKY